MSTDPRQDRKVDSLAGIRESTWRTGSAGHKKKRRSEERRPSPHNYGRKPDPP